MSCISSRQHTIDDATDISQDSKDHGTNMGPTWVLSAPGRPHVGPLNLAIRVTQELAFDICFVYPVPNTLDEWILGRGQLFIFKQGCLLDGLQILCRIPFEGNNHDLIDYGNRLSRKHICYFLFLSRQNICVAEIAHAVVFCHWYSYDLAPYIFNKVKYL